MGKITDEVITVGYLPIIPAPAHDLDTVMTFLLRSKAIATKQGQRTTVITLDQALYHKAKELILVKSGKAQKYNCLTGLIPHSNELPTGSWQALCSVWSDRYMD